MTRVIISSVNFRGPLLLLVRPVPPDRTPDGAPPPDMGDEGRTIAAGPPEAQVAALATKKRARDGADAGDLKRVAEIVMVLTAMGQMRGGREPTAAEKALVAEAREKLAGMCEAVKPKDLFSREAVRVVVEDLGLNRSKDPMLGFRPPKMSIAEKVLLTKRKMEESKEAAIHSSFSSSQHLPVSFGANFEPHGTLLHGASRFLPDKPSQMVLSAGGFQSTSTVTHVPALASSASSKQPQINETLAAVTPVKSASNPHQGGSPSLTLPRTEPGHLRLDGRLDGPTYQTLVRATSADYMPYKTPATSMQSTSAAVTKVGQANKLPNHALVKSEGIHEVNAVQNSQAIRNQEISSAIQAGQGNFLIGHQPPPGLTFVHAPSPLTNDNDIVKNVQRILQQKVSDHPSWTPPSTEYMSKPLVCQVCKITITDVESLLVCDACEKGTHLKCLQSYGNKGIPKAEWHCPKCLLSSNGKPLPPKYGRVTRTVGPSKAASNAGGTHASLEKKTENPDLKVIQQKIIANGNSGAPDLAHASNMGGSHVESAPASMMKVAEVQSNSPAAEMKKEDVMSTGASTNTLKENTGVVCITSGTKNESIDKHNDRNGSSSCDMKATSGSVLQPKTALESSCSEHPCGTVIDNNNQSQVSGGSQVSNGVELPSSAEASTIQWKEISKPFDNELKEPFSKKETSENKAGSNTRLDDGDNFQATSNGTLDYGDEARDCGRSLLPDLHTVDWVGDILQVVDEKTYYQSCRINGIQYKLQDQVLIASTCQKFAPSKLQSLWEDNNSRSKWATVDLYYFPNDLAEIVSQPSTTENSEVYASNNKKTIMAGSIYGPCEVLDTDRFREESDRRSQIGDSKSGLHPIFVCKWMYDESNGSFQPVTN
ncbi:uncharacterized protein LOC103696217 isoform X2 [Phoenix dactylifera]|uniref:Uncharacterized protein LOC103696217 isoform X2 n=1 Tax=Phoenix dactylifera TaxID=42345 RepID=A0A8B8ZF64_PHODC|nr:uncharacterized protein LOC103696217 isoform X2 [Phoenix dactylifera]